MQKLIQEWNNKVQKDNTIQQLVIGFKQDTIKAMAKRLELLAVLWLCKSAEYESTSPETFVKWLYSVEIKYKAWHEEICKHFKKK